MSSMVYKVILEFESKLQLYIVMNKHRNFEKKQKYLLDKFIWLLLLQLINVDNYNDL